MGRGGALAAAGLAVLLTILTFVYVPAEWAGIGPAGAPFTARESLVCSGLPARSGVRVVVIAVHQSVPEGRRARFMLALAFANRLHDPDRLVRRPQLPLAVHLDSNPMCTSSWAGELRACSAVRCKRPALYS
jgi:hypothetical protein